jgi:hypothetical protein
MLHKFAPQMVAFIQDFLSKIQDAKLLDAKVLLPMSVTRDPRCVVQKSKIQATGNEEVARMYAQEYRMCDGRGVDVTNYGVLLDQAAQQIEVSLKFLT